MVCNPSRLSSWAKTWMGKRLLTGIAARSCSSTVARNAAVASAFFYIAGSGDLGLCSKSSTDQLLEGLAVDRDLMGLGQPDANSLMGWKAFGPPQLLFEISHHCGWKCGRFASRHIDIE